METTEKPTQMVARFVERQVAAAEEHTKAAKQSLRLMIDEPICQNGIRGNALKAVETLDGLNKLYQQLRASAHKDLGPVEDPEPEPDPEP